MLKRVLATAGVITVLACGAHQSSVVGAFVEASRTGDLATLATVSVVGWPDDGVRTSDIQAWWINRITTSEHEPFRLQERQRRLNAAREAREARQQETTTGDDPELERIQSRVERLRVQVELEREEARKSVETWTSVDEFEGEVETSAVELIVRTPSGDHHYTLTLKRYRLARSAEASPIAAKWIVTAIEPAES